MGVLFWSSKLWEVGVVTQVKSLVWALAGKGETEKDTGLVHARVHASQLGAWKCQKLVGVGGGEEARTGGTGSFHQGVVPA